MRLSKIIKIIRLMEQQLRGHLAPSVTRVSESRSPYRVLVSCILSLRTKDKTTMEASGRLFRVVASAQAMVKLTRSRLEKLIYPVGFYHTKAKVILELSRKLIREFNGRLPRTRDELLSFRGVGRKTANLLLGLGFNIPAICVDTHVHRISNRLGWVKTRNPEDTEKALEKLIPRKEWIGLNTTLVGFGQNFCLPLSPLCNSCRVFRFCARRGVKKHR